jgi:hypothetical protein
MSALFGGYNDAIATLHVIDPIVGAWLWPFPLTDFAVRTPYTTLVGEECAAAGLVRRLASLRLLSVDLTEVAGPNLKYC